MNENPKVRQRYAGILCAGVLAVLAVGLGLGAVNVGTAHAAGKKKPSTTVASASVVSRTVTFVDPSRPTSPTAGSAGSKSRTLPTLILTPPGAGPSKRLPLLVFGHGLGALPSQYDKLLRAIAARGYVVAAPAFPLSNKNTPGGPSLLDQPNQAADMSFVITQMLKDPAVDSKWVFAGGHSLGGITTVDLLGRPDVADKRLDGVFVVAGTVNLFSSQKMFSGTPATPVLFLHGDADATVPIELGASTYEVAKKPKWFLTFLNGDHSFGLVGKPDELTRVATVYTNAMVAFTDSIRSGQDTTASLQSLVKANPTLVTLESETK
jgi:dienelactone hydrolase